MNHRDLMAGLTDILRPAPAEIGQIERKWDLAGAGYIFADRDKVSHILPPDAFDDGDDAATICGVVVTSGVELPEFGLCAHCEVGI